MKKPLYIIAVFCAFTVMWISSCKKPDTATSSPSLSGFMHDTVYVGSGSVGTYWNATSVTSSKSGSLITITGTAADGTKTELNLNVSATGSYTWDSSSYARYYSGANTYTTKNGGGGTFSITLFTSSKVEGTFFIEAFNITADYFAGVSGSFSSTY